MKLLKLSTRDKDGRIPGGSISRSVNVNQEAGFMDNFEWRQRVEALCGMVSNITLRRAKIVRHRTAT